MLYRPIAVAPIVCGMALLAAGTLAWFRYGDDPTRDPWTVQSTRKLRTVHLPAIGRTHAPLLIRTHTNNGKIAGHVLDVASHGVQGASVVVNTFDNTLHSPIVVITDADGYFEVSGLPNGKFMLGVYWGSNMRTFSDLIVRAGYVSENDVVVPD